MLACVGFAQKAIAPGEVLHVDCREEPKLSADYAVTDDGFLLVEFLGAVKVEGLSLGQAAERISARLVEDKILRKASITVTRAKAGTTPTTPVDPTIEEKPKPMVTWKGVIDSPGSIVWAEGMKLGDILGRTGVSDRTDLARVRLSRAGTEQVLDVRGWNQNPVVRDMPLLEDSTLEFVAKPVRIEGGVAKPGIVEWEQGLTVGDAIRNAGGLAERADSANARLTKLDGAVETIDAGSAGSTLLGPGDSLSIPVLPEAEPVFVTGAVQFPGPVAFKKGMTVSQAVAAAGGPLHDAVLSKTKLTRKGATKPDDIDLSHMLQGLVGDEPLNPGDRLEIPGKSSSRSRDYRTWAGAAALLFIFGR